MFKLNPLLLSLVAARGLMFPIFLLRAKELKPYSPEINDNKVGAYCLCNGLTQTLRGLPQRDRRQRRERLALQLGCALVVLIEPVTVIATGNISRLKPAR